MRNFLLLVCLCGVALGTLQAQRVWEIQGRIVDADKGEAIPFVTVFVANTSFGTAADPEGRFRLSLPEVFAEVVFSAVGYESFVLPLSADTLQEKSIPITLKEKVTLLKEAVVTVDEAKRKKYYQLFIALFIGTTPNAASCKILNPEVLDFDQTGGVFTASASDLIVIENMALGYRIKYDLEKFEVDYNTGRTVSWGQPYFEALTTNTRQQKRWEQARWETYKGSSIHLKRSMYKGNWLKEGFELRGFVRVHNENRSSDELLEEKLGKFKMGNNINVADIANNDSLNYWLNKRREPRFFEILTEELLSPDSILRAVPEQPTQKRVVFENYLYVIYKQPPHKNYMQAQDKSKQQSVLHFPESQIIIREDGMIINSSCTYQGYLYWLRIADMLPLDYQPPQK